MVIRFLSHLSQTQTVQNMKLSHLSFVSKERRILLNTKIVLEADQDPGGTIMKNKL